MNQLNSVFAFALALGALTLAPGCDQRPALAQTTAAVAPAAPVLQPTNERLQERAAARWENITRADWIAAYEYLSPDQKKVTPIGTYLQNKSHHKYENPKVQSVLQNDGKNAILRMTCLWTPVHELIKTVKLEPGQTLTQDVEMYETWRWADGDWTYVRAQRPEDFFHEHPELLKADPQKTASAVDSSAK